VIESRHFDIHYERGQDAFGRLAVLMSENAYYHINTYFRQPLRDKVPIIVYSSKQDFQSTNIIYPLLTEGIGGFTETFRNRVALPFDGSYKKFEEVLLHELVHAYINDLDSSVFRNQLLSGLNSYLPFWLSEGLPEFLALFGQDDYNNMYILDIVLNNQLPDIEYLGGFFAYRLGEAILVWIANEWSHEKVIEYFYNIRLQSNLDTATRTTFGYDFAELQQRFHLHLRREYNSLIERFSPPWEKHTRHTKAHETNERMNVFPRYNSTGLEYVYFTTNKGRIVIRFASTMTLFSDRIILSGERTPQYEEFHFQRNNLSWFPDDRNIAFVSKTSFGDHINIYDTQKRRLVRRLRFREMDSIYELDVSPDGTMITFAGQSDNRCDIYVYNLTDDSLLRLTNDLYFNSKPTFSPDGKRIAFVSEREFFCDSDEPTPLIFKNMAKNIYVYDLEKQDFYRVTHDKFNNFYPVWVDHEKLIFITEKNRIANIDIVDFSEQSRATVTNVLSGIHSIDYNAAQHSIIYSTYFQMAWDIYSIGNPFDDLEYYDYDTYYQYDMVDNFHAFFQTDDYKFHGRPQTSRRGNRQVVTLDTETVKTSSESFSDDDFRISNQRQSRPRNADEFSLRYRHLGVATRPDSTNFVLPTIRNYRPKLAIDTFWGGLAYSSSHGTIGLLQLGLSDIMGDHGLGISMEFNGSFEASNMIFSYMYLPHRIGYGMALFNFSDYQLYRSVTSGAFLENREYQTGGSLLLRFPLNRFFRIDFENAVYNYRNEWYLWEAVNPWDGYWHELSKQSEYVYQPRIGYVWDNALFGSTGPMSGYRSMSFIRHRFSTPENSFTTFYSDNRAYFPISQRYSFANRLVFGFSEGDRPENFTLSGINGIRGFYDSNHRGSRVVMANIELRYPLIDRLAIAFPLPITISNLRGSIFTDIGAVWDDDKPFRGGRDGKLEDVKMGWGFGPRLNVGFFVLKFDIAWTTNMSKHGKPTYYFTLNQDF
jgi:Tol biopolymer transport system component